MERRVFSIFLLIILVVFGTTMYVLFFTPLPTPTPTPLPSPTPTPRGAPPTIQASAIYMVDASNNHVLYTMNATQSFPMASTAKVMTAIIALENINLNTKVTIHQDAVDHAAAMNGSSALLRAGDIIKLHDLLYALLLPSGADAAVAIADTMSGSVPAFVTLMNTYAARLGLTQTQFVDPDGLTIDGPVSKTSAVDLTKLGEYAMNNSTFASIVQQQEYDLPATLYHHSYPWMNTDGLLATYTGMMGIKTGHSSIAGYCLVFEATQNGHYIIGTILGSPDGTQRDTDVSTLLNWGFGKLNGSF
jgi:D-alanyl-D-alanine carboxypeptidase (penicillin-binding protein 5/6)